MTKLLDARWHLLAEKLLTYDSANRLTATNNALSTPTDPRVWTREYDAAGRLIARTDANGTRIGQTYNADGQLASIDYPSGKRVTYDWTCSAAWPPCATTTAAPASPTTSPTASSPPSTPPPPSFPLPGPIVATTFPIHRHIQRWRLPCT